MLKFALYPNSVTPARGILFPNRGFAAHNNGFKENNRLAVRVKLGFKRSKALLHLGR